MFREALGRARQFTLPVVLCRKAVNGQCSSSIGACVVVNPEGWIVTCFHIVDAIRKLEIEANQTHALIAARKAVETDSSLSEEEKKDKLLLMPTVRPEVTEVFSVWYGCQGPVTVTNWSLVEAVDLAVGRLENFDSSWIAEYPKFKDPSRNLAPGTYLCKLGFPFHQIIPIWDAAKREFQLPQGALPMPFFPMEGMFTRDYAISPGPPSPFPLKMIETSSPGLRGQSGGPTLDSEGAVWAIQSQTAHLELGFSPPVRGGGVEHQFLNVGLGSHVESILGLLSQIGVKYELSPH